MVKNKAKFSIYLIVTIFLSLGLSISFQSILADFTLPLDNPPTCNEGDPGCDPPINESSSNQSKAGMLIVNSDGNTNGFIVSSGKVGVGTENPGAMLSVNGNVHIGGTADPGSWELYVSGQSYVSDYLRADGGLCIGTDCRTAWPSIPADADSDPTNELPLSGRNIGVTDRTINLFQDLTEVTSIYGLNALKGVLNNRINFNGIGAAGEGSVNIYDNSGNNAIYVGRDLDGIDTRISVNNEIGLISGETSVRIGDGLFNYETTQMDGMKIKTDSSSVATGLILTRTSGLSEFAGVATFPASYLGVAYSVDTNGIDEDTDIFGATAVVRKAAFGVTLSEGMMLWGKNYVEIGVRDPNDNSSGGYSHIRMNDDLVIDKHVRLNPGGEIVWGSNGLSNPTFSQYPSISGETTYGNVYAQVSDSAYFQVQNLTGSGHRPVYALSYLYSSDRRLKKDINKLDNSLDKILQLEGVSYRWKNNDSKLNIGLIAQDVKKVFPEIVEVDESSEEKFMSVEYGNLVAPLIEAVKEQQAQIEELREQVKESEATIDYLYNEIKKLN